MRKKVGGTIAGNVNPLKSKTGEAIVWDSKLSKPRMGMVADMKEDRLSAKERIKGNSQSKIGLTSSSAKKKMENRLGVSSAAKSKDSIKRTVSNNAATDIIQRTVSNTPQNLQRKGYLANLASRFDRNVVMTEVVEEDVDEDVNITRTVENDYDVDDDMEGFMDDRIIKTRDRHTENQIRNQSIPKRSRSEVDLEHDDGSDLPDWDDRVQIEVDNDAQPMKSVIASYIKERPKLEAKRSSSTRKSKQMKEVMVELKEIQGKEKQLEAQKKENSS